MKNRFQLAVTALGVVLGACGEPSGGTSTGNGFIMRASSGQEPLSVAPTLAEASGLEMTVTSVLAYIRDIRIDVGDGSSCSDLELEPGVSCSNEVGHVRFTIDGPFAVDLLTGEAMPSFDGIVVPNASVARVDIRFEPGDPDDGVISISDPLADVSFHARGTFPYDGASREFVIGLAFSEDARFDGAVDLSASSASSLVAQLDASTWLSTLPLEQCLDDGDLSLSGNTLTLSDGSGGCSEIENTLKEAIKASGSLDVE
jgi:hypothetical protein